MYTTLGLVFSPGGAGVLPFMDYIGNCAAVMGK